MAERISGDFETLVVKYYWIVARPDGRKALLIQDENGRKLAFELPDEVLGKLTADLAKLLAIPTPPKTPSA